MEAKKQTSPAEAAETQADVRAAKRGTNATAGPPPAHQDTEPPAAAKAKTADTAEQRHAPTPPGPNAAKQRTAETGTPEDSTARSAPDAQPTASERPERTNADATRATSGKADGGNEREPATATTPPEIKAPTPKPPGEARTAASQTAGRGQRQTRRQKAAQP